jgi:hypothetical protein
MKKYEAVVNQDVSEVPISEFIDSTVLLKKWGVKYSALWELANKGQLTHRPVHIGRHILFHKDTKRVRIETRAFILD